MLIQPLFKQIRNKMRSTYLVILLLAIFFVFKSLKELLIAPVSILGHSLNIVEVRFVVFGLSGVN